MLLHLLGFCLPSIVTSPHLRDLVELEEVTSSMVSSMSEYIASLFYIFLLHIVYEKCGYVDLVAKQAETSMLTAVEEVKALPSYLSDGEVATFYDTYK